MVKCEEKNICSVVTEKDHTHNHLWRSDMKEQPLKGQS